MVERLDNKMKKHGMVGEVTTVLTNIETGEITTNTEYNTQTIHMVYYQFNPSFSGFGNSSIHSYIYISDNTNELNQFSGTIVSTNQTFNIGGSAISGEYWPQYLFDEANNRAIYTFKQRFSPPGSGTRTINTISLYSNGGANQYMCGLKMNTPCIQSSLEILDVFYKIYVYFDPTLNINNPNVHNYTAIFNNLGYRIMANSSLTFYAEGTTTSVNSNYTYSSLAAFTISQDPDIRQITGQRLHPSNTIWDRSYPNLWYYKEPSTNTVDVSQGTVLCTYNFGLNDWVGTIINKLGRIRGAYNWGTEYYYPQSTTPILEPNAPKLQSVYLKSATSHSTNFAYLDPSTIGSSTAELVINDSDFVDPEKPRMFQIDITTGGDISTAEYKVKFRSCFGFPSNFFTNEQPWSLTGIYQRYGGLPPGQAPYFSNTYNGGYFNHVKPVDDKHVVSSSPTGITVLNVYTLRYKNFDQYSTPALMSSTIQDAIPMSDGSILITTLSEGLLKLSSDRSTITKFTGVGAGVNEDTCYVATSKYNGDIWAMFEGALAKYTNSTDTWTIYNSSTPITFIHSEFNPTWSNTLAIFCRKDDLADEILLLRNNSAAMTWWSPASPTPLNTSATGVNAMYKWASNSRADYSERVRNLPGTSVWFYPNNNGQFSRMTYNTNSGTQIGAHALSGYCPLAIREVYKGGQWLMRTFENNNNSGSSYPSTSSFYDSTALVSRYTCNSQFNTFGSNIYVSNFMDDYGTAIFFYTQSTYPYYCGLLNPMPPKTMPETWREYGWNSSTNQWEIDNPNSKPVHATMEDLPDGLKCSFNPTGANDFITDEYWVGYLSTGLHKDNSTTATFSSADHMRVAYNTTDLSSHLVPTVSLGPTTEQISMHTLGEQRYSWNGGVSSAGMNGSTVADSHRSELWFDGDFDFTFYTQRYSNSTNTTNTTSYISLYERDAVSPSSQWAFQFRYDGYLVAENDVARTTRTLPDKDNQKYSIKRSGSTVTYYVDDILIYTSLVTSSNPLRVMIRTPSSDQCRSYYNMTCTYTEQRRVLKIGSPINQTGIYDPTYAMVEAWLTDPRTTKITIDGNPAEVLTDPLATPLQGQVLLLQKCGMLVFNPADEGLPVTCEAMILQET